MAGSAVHDPVASLLMTQPAQTAWTIVHGRIVADHGRITTVDLARVVERHNQLARALAGH
jgi:8-oxoguanine deaminase